ncbi:MAG: hypothetical protein V7707_19880 [Motiliproteus sp.]
MVDLIDAERFGFNVDSPAQPENLQLLISGVILYAVLMAIPFVPGMEISLALLMVFGPTAALPVYAATVLALAISCLVGGTLPISLIAKLFGSLGLHRSRQLVLKLQFMSSKDRLNFLLKHTPKRIVPMLLKHRYIAIIVALNTPGNAVIGGGGGIALLAGISGLFTLPRFILAVSLAALPIPLVIFLGGI